MRNCTYQIIVCIIVGIGFSACGTLRTMKHPAVSTPDVSKPTPKKPLKISVWLLGFFNNEVPDGFRPQWIDYSMMLDGGRVEDSLKEYFLAAHDIEITPPPKWFSSNSPEDSLKNEEVFDKFMPILEVMNHSLKSGSFPSDFQGVQWVDLSNSSLTSSDIDSQVVCVVVGLETLTKQRMGQNYLRSGLGVILFQKNGQYLGMAISEYDFTHYFWSHMAKQVIGNIEEQLRLPQKINLFEDIQKRHDNRLTNGQYCSSFGLAKFSKELATQNRIDVLNFIRNFGSKYPLEANILSISWTTNDRFNGGRAYGSATPAIQFLSMVTLMGLHNVFEDSSSNFIYAAIAVSSLFSSKHHLFLRRGNCTDTYGRLFDGVSLFFKNNIDIFFYDNDDQGRKKGKDWVSFSPGVGLNVHTHNFQLQLGFNYNYQTNFKTRFTEPSLFFGVGWYGKIF